MLHKFRLLLTTAMLAIFMIACGSETNDNAEGTDQALDAVEVQSDDASTADTSNETNETEDSKADTATEENETAAEVADEPEANASETETPDSETPDSETTESAEETTEENSDESFYIAVERILEATGLNAKDYIFSFEHTTDYVEVELREKTEDEVTPLAGIYRYFPQTDELLVSDYLTGEFIPHENLQ